MSNRRVQTDKEMRYRMCLAGAFAGLIAWFIGVWIPFLVTLEDDAGRLTKALAPGWVAFLLGTSPEDDRWIFEVLDASLIGLFIGAAYAVFASRLSREEVTHAQTLGRVLIGALGGCVAGALGIV
ncbi:MAG: hypothetical protein ACREAM_03315, partial [Blastocatellia bacterium]